MIQLSSWKIGKKNLLNATLFT
jgi:hypothetical protein